MESAIRPARAEDAAEIVLSADWLECGRESIGDMIKSIIDLAAESHAELLRITVPKSIGFRRSRVRYLSNVLYEHPL